MNSKQVKSSALLVFAVALCAMSGQSSALSLEPSVTIHLADLNFESPEGVRVAYGRVRSAAHQVCGTSSSIWDTSAWSSWRECYRKTIEATVNRIDRPTLTALHRATTKPPLDLRAQTTGRIPR
jgi:UrcA family protein